MILPISHFLPVLLDGVSECKEHPLFECGLGHDLAHNIILLLHVFLAKGGDPFDEGSSLGPERTPPAHRHHEVLLLLTSLIEVSPSAEVVAQPKLSLARAHPVHDVHGRDLVSIDTLAIQIQLPPKEEELLAHLMGYVAINYRVSFVVLVDHVEGLAVPDTQAKALPVNDVVTKDTMKLAHLALEVDHDLGSR